jgi:Flp pilus assembly protein TadG
MKKKSILPRSPRGQSLVELAISLVILLYLLSGAAEFAILFFQYVQLRDAAQEGALYGSINPPRDAATEQAIKTRAKASSGSPIKLATDPNVDVIVDVIDKPCEGGAIKVTVTYPHKIFMPFMAKIIGPTRMLRAEVIDTILTPAPLPSGACPPYP